jgi:hypothetical protein
MASGVMETMEARWQIAARLFTRHKQHDCRRTPTGSHWKIKQPKIPIYHMVAGSFRP